MALEQTTDLEWFRPREHLKPKGVFAFFGMRGGGKTTMMREVIFHLRHHFTEVYVFSATEDSNETWSKHVPSTFIYNGFFPEKLDNIIKRQRKRIEAYNRSNGALPFPHTLIVAEDLMAEGKKYVNDPGVRTLHMNGRHLGFTLCETVQYLMDLPRGLRSNINMAFLMKENSAGNVQRIHDAWVSMVCDLGQFRDIMKEVTKDYGVLVINCDKDPDEAMTWYKAPGEGRGNFKVGGRAFWAFHFSHGKGRVAASKIRGASSLKPKAALEATVGQRRRPSQGRTLRLLPPSSTPKSAKRSAPKSSTRSATRVPLRSGLRRKRQVSKK